MLCLLLTASPFRFEFLNSVVNSLGNIFACFCNAELVVVLSGFYSEACS